MVINGNVDLFVYKKKEKEFEQNRQVLKYYRLIIDNDDEVEEMACTEECFDKVQTGKLNRLEFQYNSKADRNAFKFTGVVGNGNNTNTNNNTK